MSDTTADDKSPHDQPSHDHTPVEDQAPVADQENAQDQAPWPDAETLRAKYIPPALNEPDAAARVAASAGAARAAARAVTAARLANPDAAAKPSTRARPVPTAAGSEVAVRSAEADRAAGTVPFTASNTVIDRSQYVINAAGADGQELSVPPTSVYGNPPAMAPSDSGRMVDASAPRVVYVEAPTPPVKKSNRGVGSLLAALSALAFALLFALVIFALFYVTTGRIVTNFLGQASFFVPVVLFAIGFVVLVLVANRAGWWAYALGSIAVGAFTYVATIGVLLLLTGVISSTPQEASADLSRALVNPLVIAAGVLAREVSLWTGWAISTRGRRVSARNAEAAAAYQRDLDDRDHHFAERNLRDIPQPKNDQPHHDQPATASGPAPE